MKKDKNLKEEKSEEIENEEIDNETEELKQKLEETEDKYKRTIADYQNLEKRTQREKHEWARIANKELLLRILPVLDTLFMAQKHIKDAGLDLSIQQFLGALKTEGVEKIDTKGKSFDPKLMECVDTVEGEENKVIEEVSPGYTLFETVLKPARVKVGKKRKDEKKEEELAKEELQKNDYV